MYFKATRFTTVVGIFQGSTEGFGWSRVAFGLQDQQQVDANSGHAIKQEGLLF